MDFILSLFFILIILIFSGVFRTLLSKSINKKLSQNTSNEDDEQITYNDNTDYEKEITKSEEKKTDLRELFEEYTLKRKNEVYNKDSYINKNTITFDNRVKAEKLKGKKDIIRKSRFKKEEVLQSKEREFLNSLNKKNTQENVALSLDKKPALDRIKKLSYYKQAVVLSEILGPPKGLDF